MKKRAAKIEVMQDGKKLLVTPSQFLLAKHIAELWPLAEVKFEYQPFVNRRWRADISVTRPTSENTQFYLIECDGHYQGKHGAGWGSDNEKANKCQANGYKYFRFKNQEIDRGKAKQWLSENL